eukprot:744236-Pyramimonas_sp.AAC.1
MLRYWRSRTSGLRRLPDRLSALAISLELLLISNSKRAVRQRAMPWGPKGRRLILPGDRAGHSVGPDAQITARSPAEVLEALKADRASVLRAKLAHELD